MCVKCDSSVFLNTNYCREHYLTAHGKPPEFRKVKEFAIRDFLTVYLLSNYNIKPIFNKKLALTRLIPDLQFTYLQTQILIEIDEHQHNKGTYDLTDNKRELQIAQNIKRTVIIRINPDRYRKHPSIWTKHTQIKTPGEIENVVNVNVEEWERRKKIIIQCIDMALEDVKININNQTLNINQSIIKYYYVFYEVDKVANEFGNA